MKLLLRRDQKSAGLLSKKVVFTLAVRAELTPEEKANIAKYKLGETLLYARDTVVDGGSGILGLASRIAINMANLTITVNDLETGKVVECQDIIEMLAVEDHIKQTASTFKLVLEAASKFGGEEVLQLA